MINCFIVDDEQHSIDTITEYISKANGLRLIRAFTNPLDVIKEISAGERPHLIFLDINMPEITGLELAKLLPPEIGLIYITAFSDHALSAFDTNVYDFLLKPISFSRFLRCVNKVQQRIDPSAVNISNKRDYFFINPGIKGKMVKLAFKDITYIQGLKNYIIINYTGDKQVTYLTMQEIEQALPMEWFIRIHKSFIINIDHIKSIDGNTFIITENISLPLGGKYKDQVMLTINKSSLISKRINI